jgi:hypothetical protein
MFYFFYMGVEVCLRKVAVNSTSALRLQGIWFGIFQYASQDASLSWWIRAQVFSL